MDENERGKILELRKPYLCGYRGPDLVKKPRILTKRPYEGENIVGSITNSFLLECDIGLVPDNIDAFRSAIEEIISYYMALLCPDCRQKMAERLLNDIPAMLARASELVPDARSEYGEFHLKEK
jgi:hypothetical protein